MVIGGNPHRIEISGIIDVVNFLRVPLVPRTRTLMAAPLPLACASSHPDYKRSNELFYRIGINIINKRNLK